MKIEITTENGQTESFPITQAELAAWDVYAENHPHLFRSLPYSAVLRMFLTNFRLSPNFYVRPEAQA